MTTVSTILREAATLPWTQRALAIEGNGRACHPRDPRAVAFCTDGAIYRAAIAYPPSIRIQAKRALYSVIGRDLVDWNDEPGRTAEEVKAKLLEAANAQA